MANTNIDWKLIVQHQTYMKQPGKKTKTNINTKQSFSLFQWVKKEIYKTVIYLWVWGYNGLSMWVFMRLFPSAAQTFCPIFRKNKNGDPETILYQFLTPSLFLIAGFLIVQKILIFGGLGFLSDLRFFARSQLPVFQTTYVFGGLQSPFLFLC